MKNHFLILVFVVLIEATNREINSLQFVFKLSYILYHMNYNIVQMNLKKYIEKNT
jgi:hypothetical protein